MQKFVSSPVGIRDHPDMRSWVGGAKPLQEILATALNLLQDFGHTHPWLALIFNFRFFCPHVFPSVQSLIIWCRTKSQRTHCPALVSLPSTISWLCQHYLPQMANPLPVCVPGFPLTLSGNSAMVQARGLVIFKHYTSLTSGRRPWLPNLICPFGCHVGCKTWS